MSKTAKFKNYHNQVASFKEGDHIEVAQVPDDDKATMGVYLRSLVLRIKLGTLDGILVDYETKFKEERKILTSVKERC